MVGILGWIYRYEDRSQGWREFSLRRGEEELIEGHTY
jgi:hypothetical protein